ncbi:B-cell receptor CD22-like [Bufo bufo]|uniref:B-cell receptor CD22-like n=1 Tax=Bufo bufo TaxID=8384 RepID=UPI001ABEDAF7|nr:B-cell receptor CD22-like [Bufo bufo]XP_040276974.1 B-cell receptor CD22-like [Bufo bufo]XP_040276983.1 B-cell receptor CD22-like [Bufo bufo]
MNDVKQIYLLFICQGFYLSSVCQEWTFPSTITALIGSCVEIPCTYQPAWTSGTSRTVWYLYKFMQKDPEILNTRESSSVMAEYRDRTSLVPGENSCTLRIDNVRRGDGDEYYYPGDRNTDANRKQSRTVYLRVTDKVDVRLYWFKVMTEGEATIMQCTADHTCRSSPPSLRWNKPGQVKNKSVEISLEDWREESELTYIPSYVDHGSPVQCIATYPNGKDFKVSGTLNIKYAPKNVTVAVISIDEVMEGSDVMLQCNSFSNPAVYEYEWYKGKSKLPDTRRKITVRNVTRDMEPYSCAVRNHLGRRESAPTEIPVQYATTGSNITVKINDGFTELICEVLSSRPDVTHYIWMKDGSILQNETGKTLTIYSNDKSYRKYSCSPNGSPEDSSLEETCEKCDSPDLPLILGTAAGVFIIFFLILVIYFYLRRKKKSALPTSPIHGTISTEKTTAKDENQYGNIQSNHHAEPPSMRPDNSVDMNVDENYVIYSNSEALQPSCEVEYSTIAHGQPEQRPLTPSRVRNVEDVEYATLKH